MAVGPADVESPRLLAGGCLRGAHALVTGAGSGIGRAVACRLVELGATVTGIGRRSERLQETERLTLRPPEGGCAPEGGCGGRFLWETLDVRDRRASVAMLDRLTETMDGRLDLLVNNAGGQFVSPALGISPRGMAAVLDLNMTAVAHLIQAARPALALARGTVVTISLSSPERGIPGIAHSAAARAAILAWTAQLADDWRDEGISFYAVAPGTVLTEGMRGELTPETLARTLSTTPLRSDTTVDEVAEWVSALAAGAGGLASGQVLMMDGGAGIHGVRALG